MRAVLDPNVLISALLSPTGAPARVIRAWVRGEFELIVSPLLLSELKRALAYDKLRKRIPPEEARAAIKWLADSAIVVSDPVDPPSVGSPDPGDDYLIALAEAEQAVIVSGDEHLLSLRDLPIYSAAGFLALLQTA